MVSVNKKPIITNAQMNPIATVLTGLDKTIDEMKISCFTKNKTGILYSNINDLNIKEKRMISLKFDEIKKVINKLNKILNLKKQDFETRRFISSHLSSLWESAAGLEDKRLSGYGEVDESLKKILNPAVAEITRLLNEADNILWE